MLNIVSAGCYIIGAFTQGLALLNILKQPRLWVFIFGWPAVILHGYLLYRLIDLNIGQNLTEFNLLSLAAWTTSLVILIVALKKPIGYLSVFIFPIAAISIFLALQFPSHHIINTASHPKQFIHILLSVITFSILAIAGLQVIMLAIQERFLRLKYFEISHSLPPIETMEKLLFQMIAIGAFLLSTVLISSIYFFHDMISRQILQKTILTFLAWIVFIILLIGRHYFGWRGKKAMYCTLGGVVLLTATYFSSLIIMELLP